MAHDFLLCQEPEKTRKLNRQNKFVHWDGFFAAGNSRFSFIIFAFGAKSPVARARAARNSSVQLSEYVPSTYPGSAANGFKREGEKRALMNWEQPRGESDESCNGYCAAECSGSKLRLRSGAITWSDESESRPNTVKLTAQPLSNADLDALPLVPWGPHRMLLTTRHMKFKTAGGSPLKTCGDPAHINSSVGDCSKPRGGASLKTRGGASLKTSWGIPAQDLSGRLLKTFTSGGLAGSGKKDAHTDRPHGMGKLVGAFHASLVELGSGDVHSGSGGLHPLAGFWVLGASHCVWVLGLVMWHIRGFSGSGGIASHSGSGGISTRACGSLGFGGCTFGFRGHRSDPGAITFGFWEHRLGSGGVRAGFRFLPWGRVRAFNGSILVLPCRGPRA
ncbi:hypothetical protein B0H13DRAFT_2473119 [Mycena leptocephala]|nr:hypothetical protein B0H13DRAFT_2473119 [Mycena leptocephala]